MTFLKCQIQCVKGHLGAEFEQKNTLSWTVSFLDKIFDVSKKYTLNQKCIEKVHCLA